MKLNAFFYLSAVTVLFSLEAVPSSYAMQTGNKRSRSDATNWSQSVNRGAKFELLRSLPPAIFKEVMGDLSEQGQTCAGASCKSFQESEDRYRLHAKRNAIVVPANKQYRNLRSFIKYLYKYKRVQLPVASSSSLNSAGDSKSMGNGSESKTNDIGSFITQINLGQLRPVPPSQPDSPPDASVEDVLKAIQTIFPDLQELRLANADLQENDLQVIGQMKNLRVLDLGGTSFYHAGIQHLSNLTEMRRLNLSAPGVAPSNFDSAAQFLHLSKMHHLVYLDFTQSPQTARAFQEWILSITDDNNAFAIYRRALMLDYGTDDHKGPPVDSKLAIATYEKAAELGHPLAQTQLAKFYQKGIGVKKDHAKAYTWFKKAHLQGHAGAGRGYLDTRFSRFTPEELTLKHASLLRHPEPTKGSRKEHFNYQDDLGWMYLKGLGVTQNDLQAVYWIRKAAEKGLAVAQHSLGYMYQKGRGVKQDNSRAAEMYQKAAELGSAEAQGNLGALYSGALYDDGKGVVQDYPRAGVVQDYPRAVEWYRKAAEQGLADAQYEMGRMYCYGSGVDQDLIRAGEWFTKAAEQGLADAQQCLGTLYADGLGVQQDSARAVGWFRKAAEQGSISAQNYLGVYFDTGYEVARDGVRAVEWFERAAEMGSTYAQSYLGFIYFIGRGVDQDDARAEEWYRKAAENGMPEAQHSLGIMYQTGQGVVQNYVQAVEWYRKAVEKDLAIAQFSLGSLYENGHGVDLNLEEAIRLYRLAAAQGNEDARARLNVLEIEATGDL